MTRFHPKYSILPLAFSLILLLSITTLPASVQCLTTSNILPLYSPKSKIFGNTLLSTSYSQKTETSQLFLSQKNKQNNNNLDNSNTNTKYEFALQELRFTLNSLKKQSDTVSYQTLSQSQRNDIESYIRTIIAFKESPIPLENLSSNSGMLLIGKWKLVFSTEDTTLNNLPKEARVALDIKDNTRLDYILEFTTRVFALKKLIARSSYKIEPSSGLLSFEYEEVIADVFGMSIPTGLFGLLKGRVNYIQSIYFDGKIWIEGGYDSTNDRDYFNAYIRDE